MKIENSVRKIIERVKRNGDVAVSFYTKKFDGVVIKPSEFKVSLEKIKDAKNKVDKKLYLALKKAAENIRIFHTFQMKHLKKSWSISRAGIESGEYVRPVESVAVYAPGARYSYPSSVLMTVIPASIAGVKKIIMLTPPKNISPSVLVAADISGVDEIYTVGGVQSVAAAAFGTKMIPKVDMIVGPGNKYITEAKRQLFGTVGIDMLAGPSEVVIIADGGAPPEFIAYDLLAQTEHDPSSRAFLFTDSKKIIDEVKNMIPGKYKKQIKIRKVAITEAIKISNTLAPEHLELLLKNPRKYFAYVKNAGAVFAGYHTPTAIGDYFAGPSHVLPTASTARFSSGISAHTFLKKTTFVFAGEKSIGIWPEQVEAIAAAEGLVYHSESAKIRRRNNKIDGILTS